MQAHSKNSLKQNVPKSLHEMQANKTSSKPWYNSEVFSGTRQNSNNSTVVTKRKEYVHSPHTVIQSQS